MTRWQGRFFELDAHAMNRRAKDVIAVSCVFKDAVERTLQLRHSDARLDLGDGGLLRFEVKVIRRLLLGGRLAHADCAAYICAVAVDDGVYVNHHQVAHFQLARGGRPCAMLVRGPDETYVRQNSSAPALRIAYSAAAAT